MIEDRTRRDLLAVFGSAALFGVVGCSSVGGAGLAGDEGEKASEMLSSYRGIFRINQFQAKPGMGDDLFALIESFRHHIQSSDGCLGVELLRNLDAPDQIVVFELWRDQEAHRASAANVPEGTFPKAMALMDGPPDGGYYRQS